MNNANAENALSNLVVDFDYISAKQALDKIIEIFGIETVKEYIDAVATVNKSKTKRPQPSPFHI